MSDLDTAVSRGIDFLNENGPAEWWNRIDLETLDLSDGDTCVLGQVFQADADMTGYSNGYIFAVYNYEDVIENNPVRFGFCAIHYGEINGVWTREIEKIRAEVAA